MCQQAYKEARNFIINKYREDMSRRLSFMEVRAELAGDAGGLQRIYSFLDHWGLINYQSGDGAQQAASDVTPFAVAPSCELSHKRIFPERLLFARGSYHLFVQSQLEGEAEIL